jgi:hypothetical protein
MRCAKAGMRGWCHGEVGEASAARIPAPSLQAPTRFRTGERFQRPPALGVANEIQAYPLRRRLNCDEAFPGRTMLEEGRPAGLINNVVAIRASGATCLPVHNVFSKTIPKGSYLLSCRA